MVVDVARDMAQVYQHIENSDWKPLELGYAPVENGDVTLLDVRHITDFAKQVETQDEDGEPLEVYQDGDPVVAVAFGHGAGYHKNIAFVVIGPAERVNNYIRHFHTEPH